MKIKQNRCTQRTKEAKNYTYQLRTNLTKAQTGKKKKTKQGANCRMAMKIKLTKMLRGKERKKRKKEYTHIQIYKVKQR